MSRDSNEKAVREYVAEKMPARIKKLMAAAKWDLQSGPFTKRDMTDQGFRIKWPGYTKAIDEIGAWADKHIPSSLTVDTFAGGVFEGEPEGWKDDETGEWNEPNWEDYTSYSHRDIMLAVFGDLVRHGGL